MSFYDDLKYLEEEILRFQRTVPTSMGPRDPGQSSTLVHERTGRGGQQLATGATTSRRGPGNVGVSAGAQGERFAPSPATPRPGGGATLEVTGSRGGGPPVGRSVIGVGGLTGTKDPGQPEVKGSVRRGSGSYRGGTQPRVTVTGSRAAGGPAVGTTAGRPTPPAGGGRQTGPTASQDWYNKQPPAGGGSSTRPPSAPPSQAGRGITNPAAGGARRGGGMLSTGNEARQQAALAEQRGRIGRPSPRGPMAADPVAAEKQVQANRTRQMQGSPDALSTRQLIQQGQQPPAPTTGRRTQPGRTTPERAAAGAVAGALPAIAGAKMGLGRFRNPESVAARTAAGQVGPQMLRDIGIRKARDILPTGMMEGLKRSRAGHIMAQAARILGLKESAYPMSQGAPERRPAPPAAPAPGPTSTTLLPRGVPPVQRQLQGTPMDRIREAGRSAPR